MEPRLCAMRGEARPGEVTEVPLSLSLAKNHFWLVATQKKRRVLIIQILFSCSIADLISDFQHQLNSFTFVNIGFDLLILFLILNSLLPAQFQF